MGCIDQGIIQHHQVTYATFCNMQQASKSLHTILDVARSDFRSGANDTSVGELDQRSTIATGHSICYIFINDPGNGIHQLAVCSFNLV
jgi:hypothetical protein